MKLNSTVVFVKDIAASTAFYRDNLGLEIEHDFGANVAFKGGLAIWAIWKEHIIGSSLEAFSDSNRFELYFEEDDIPGLFSRLNNGAVRFLHGVQEEPWGQLTIRFFDPDGHLIEVGEPLGVFLRRMHEGGLTPEEVSERSGVPVGAVLSFLK